MRLISLLLLTTFLVGCTTDKADESPSLVIPEEPELQAMVLDLAAANNLIELPLACIDQEYPNKLGQVLVSGDDLGAPAALHPAFFGCFDWHSAVHGHWSLVALLSQFPELERAGEAKARLQARLTAENIQGEVDYFKGPYSTSYERTYGWAWLLKLQEALDNWQDPLGVELAGNLQPLTDLIVERYHDYLPKLVYPIRTGEHPNTGFGLSFAWDYAVSAADTALQNLIASRARDFFLEDQGANFSWEPSGYDFLSPILEEVDIMRRILPADEFHSWLTGFLPELSEPAFSLEVGEVRDRTDGKLVHLDGLNFSRAWVLYGLTQQYPAYSHLVGVANAHIDYSLPNLVGDAYEGGHWLGSFAIYALQATLVGE